MYLITGAAGFIGGCFTRKLSAQGQALCLVDKLTYAGNLDSINEALQLPNVSFHRVDIADQDAIATLLREHNIRYVVNFAAESHVDRSIDGPEIFAVNNVVGTVKLLVAVRHYWQELAAQEQGQFRFLHVSTDEVYGTLGATGSFTETTPYAPNSPYAASKASSDQFVRAFHHTYGLPVITTNCSNNYGPYQFPEKLIPLMILNAVAEKALPVYGDGMQVRDWLHVEDHCDAIELVLAKGRVGEVYNVGGGTELPNIEVVRTICDAVAERLGRSTESVRNLMTHVTDRPGHDRRYSIDSSKIQRELGWQPRRPFIDGLHETVDWYLSNDQWVSRVKSGAYVRHGLEQR